MAYTYLSTDKVRQEYHETVTNHHLRGRPGYTPTVNWSIAIRLPFPAVGGGTWLEPVHPATAEAWRAYINVMAHHGETLTSAGGVDHARNIAGTNWPSLHAYLLACDSPPNSRKTAAFIRDIEAIRTRSGPNGPEQVFRNLRGDRMHDQINATRAAIATGIDWTTVTGDDTEGDPDMITPTSPRPVIEDLQHALNTILQLEPVLDRDGIWGAKTQAAIDTAHTAAGLPNHVGQEAITTPTLSVIANVTADIGFEVDTVPVVKAIRRL